MRSGRGGEAVRGERARRPPHKDVLQAGGGRWPGSAHCAVCLTFDFDVGDTPADGAGRTIDPERLYAARVGVNRILELLKRYEMIATFFVSALTARGHPEAAQAIVRAGHEIAHYAGGIEQAGGWETGLEDLPTTLEHGAQVLARYTGARPLGFRVSSSPVPLALLRAVARAGYFYDSSLMDDERPYLLEGAGSGQFIELPGDRALNDSSYFRPVTPAGPLLSAPSQVLEIWTDEFEGCYEAGGCMVLTMHPEIIGRHHRLKLLERFLQYMARRRRRLFISSCIEIARHALIINAPR